MQITRIGARVALVALFAVVVVAMTGCTSGSVGRAGTGGVANLPPDLPPYPDPTKKYCKVWVPPVYRMVPKLVQCKPGHEKCTNVTVMETTAKDVLVKPCERKCASLCPTTCKESLVQVKPGGYRWENCSGCWQYTYRPPQYKWCERTVTEEGIGYCVESPAEYKTVVDTRPVTKRRTEYVPPEYQVKYVREVWVPGHWEWQASEGCDCTADRRRWSRPHLLSRKTVGCPPVQRGPLDCGCPPVN